MEADYKAKLDSLKKNFDNEEVQRLSKKNQEKDG